MRRPQRFVVSVLTLIAATSVGGGSLHAQSRLSAAVTVPDAAAPAPSAAQPAPVLRAGDVLRIIVWQRPELTGDFTVSPDGFVLHPLYRELLVAGVPLSDVEAHLRMLLERFDQEPRFVLQPLLHVAVGGEVRLPNLYLVGAQTTIAQAVAMAGGATEFARWDRVHLFRDGTEQVIDLTRPGSLAAQTSLRSGDQVVVERRRSLWNQYLGPAVAITGATAAVITAVARYHYYHR
jgi:protein involved in polysaccharide export with SLBB domain